jgi:hypothetical protein
MRREELAMSPFLGDRRACMVAKMESEFHMPSFWSYKSSHHRPMLTSKKINRMDAAYLTL